ncbi:uncharacterized protein HD556DRAFT_1443449 [Suillus plorans]|uniref:Uncharacterized protein n=1 Tax=Suillus plorans TaxID=116603 RepID=A0A9P7APF5_9AGAM|nr:uncharacterized protein HD556DRAFT_1443449 [Suillus plorans]KAG1793658.1 hypothetical protein HD556DRAFT_1443449 [Suillus plorans]
MVTMDGSDTTSGPITYYCILNIKIDDRTKARYIPATVVAGSQWSGHPSNPSAHVHHADNTCGLSASGSSMRKCALSSIIDPPVPIKKATICVLSLLDTNNEDIPSPDPASSNKLIPQLDNEEEADIRYLDYIQLYS